MSSENGTDKFVPTGVPGLDYVLMGGFLREGFYLLQGDPGSGKTTVALQYVLGRLRAGERCLYITLTESRRDLESACASHGWSLDGIELCDLTKSAANMAGEPESSVFHPSETELGETTQAIVAAVDKAKPRHVVFDGLSEMRLLSGNPLVYRRQLLALREFFAERRHRTAPRRPIGGVRRGAAGEPGRRQHRPGADAAGVRAGAAAAVRHQGPRVELPRGLPRLRVAGRNPPGAERVQEADRGARKGAAPVEDLLARR